MPSPDVPPAAVRILALDSAGSGCSVAACLGAEPVVGSKLQLAVGHADRLVPLVRDVTQRAGWTWDMVDLLVVTVGPGNFSGIRAGLAAARGIALARGLPVLGVTVFEALVAREASDGPQLAVVPGRDDTFYVQPFMDPQWPEAVPSAVTREALRAMSRPGVVVRADVDALDATDVARAGLLKLASGSRATPGFALRPLYLREAGARREAGRPLVRSAA